MTRSKSLFAPLSVLFFFLAGAAAAILWDLREKAAPREPAPARPIEAARKRPGRTPRPAGRTPSPPRGTRGVDAKRPVPAKAPPRARKIDPRFATVGIPMKARPAADAPRAELSEAQAQRILKSVVEAHGSYGLSPGCLWARPLGYRDARYAFEVVTADCESVVAGSVVGRWTVDASSGEASYQTPEGAYRRAP